MPRAGYNKSMIVPRRIRISHELSSTLPYFETNFDSNKPPVMELKDAQEAARLQLGWVLYLSFEHVGRQMNDPLVTIALSQLIHSNILEHILIISKAKFPILTRSNSIPGARPFGKRDIQKI